MKVTPIITCFDDQDAYKFFMQYAILRFYPDARVRYSFIIRDPEVVFPDGFADELRKQVCCFEDLRFTKEMEAHLAGKVPWFDDTYFNYLRKYRYNPAEVSINQTEGKLEIMIEGLWHKAIFWEVPLMACISELYFRLKGISDHIDLNIPRWEKKFRAFSAMNISVIEFGTRRRKSKLVQEKAIETFIRVAPECIKGTSNVMFARKFGIKASGTQAHEWFMFHAARFGFQKANAIALERWVDTYHGALGIALTDTFTTDIFFRDFTLQNSKLFDGVRHDSGDPVVFAGKTIRHYLDKQVVLPNGVIPKIIVFSDSIDSLGKISVIEDFIRNKLFSVYGIGTWITNDLIDGNNDRVKPLNMVIKLTGALPDGNKAWRKCAKLTDSHEKYTGDKGTIRKYLEELDQKG